MDGEAWWAIICGGHKESDTIEQLTHTHTHTHVGIVKHAFSEDSLEVKRTIPLF